ncbi:hypothetical protein niasHT_019900 [Heterodera trifolii]|uniref:MULE transposase domain-containing protein n=1 Tax=Heterodera trifolii TaxID=157864 RepID=A0ABD2L5X3_9BILA
MIRQLNDSSTRRFVNSAKMRRFVNSVKKLRFVNSTIRQLSQNEGRLLITTTAAFFLSNARTQSRPNKPNTPQGSHSINLALTAVMRRQKRKIDGNIDRVNPLNYWTRLALCVHSLLPGKQRKYFEEALNAVKAVIAPSTPARVISDFEIATIRAMRETFPAAQLTGCLFHMSQAVFRKWREMGLAELYASDEEQGEGARNSFRKLLAQALIPGQHVRRGFALIKPAPSLLLRALIEPTQFNQQQCHCG